MIVYSAHGSQDLNVKAADMLFAFDLACTLLTVYVHASEPITEEVSVTFVSAEGSQYSTLIESRILQDESDYVYAAQGTIAINEGDKIWVQVTNANEIGTVGVTVKMEK